MTKSTVFEERKKGFKDLLLLLVATIVLGGLFLFVFFNPDYSKIFYIIVSAIALYLSVFYVRTDHREKDLKVLPPQKFPSLSVLIPSYNSANSIGNCLRYVLAIKYPRPFTITVIDDCSTDNTQEVLKEFPSVKVVHNPHNKGKSKSLNSAIRMATTELVVCIDSDTYPNPNVFLDCVPQFYTKEKVGAVTPFITVANPKTWVQKIQEIEYFFGFGFFPKVASKLDGLYVAPGPLSIFNRKVLMEIGGYDEDNLTEDMEIALRLHAHGYSLGYAPSSVPTEVPDTWGGLYHQRTRWYRGTIFNIIKYKNMFFNRKLKSFGGFFFPALVLFVTTVILSFLVIWSLILFSIFYTLSAWSLSLANGHFPLELPAEITVPSLLVFLAMAAIIYYVFFVRSISMLNIKRSRNMVLPITITLLFYPLWISVVYTTSLFQELAATKRSW
ncbi:glycosyltransferase family 2 protein [Candidatus Micrarchaeota archaeon]|nr:glycosyltransferase family 2 protein [Candidatus Micrarchaeota archaeon]MBU1930404.1 glycosyltransferase family 2 protein [Candidatus Micrarchaeota archaeon]